MPGLPADLTATVFTDGELTTSAKWYSRVFAFINAIRGAVDPLTTIWSATHTATVTVPTATWTPVVVDTIKVDTTNQGFPDGGYTVQDAGAYMVDGVVELATDNGVGARRIGGLAINGVVPNGDGYRAGFAPQSAGAHGIAVGPAPITLSVGDVLQVAIWQDSGISIVSTPGITCLTVRRLT